MDSKDQIESMARKYKEEMLRMYKKSGGTADKNVKSITPTRDKETTPSIKPQERASVEKKEPSESPKEVYRKEIVNTSDEKPKMAKFPTPEEIMRKESVESEGNVPVMPKTRENTVSEPDNFQGNYNSEEFSDLNDKLEPRYKGEETEISPDVSGTGYIKAEVKTGSGAVPIENAVVLITRKKNGKNYLLKMLITDESGSTETVSLPAPNASFSETPDPSEKPFADYYISAYADGFYAENDMEVPVFSGVKSIQPIALIPKSSDDNSFMSE